MQKDGNTMSNSLVASCLGKHKGGGELSQERTRRITRIRIWLLKDGEGYICESADPPLVGDLPPIMKFQPIPQQQHCYCNASNVWCFDLGWC
ncbi:hypothetical protein BDR04DRAFT_26690 [Suillus decipiens]|nr:hypothetical protein BDR04DRAFT_26690 [Suillus decipiens]